MIDLRWVNGIGYKKEIRETVARLNAEELENPASERWSYVAEQRGALWAIRCYDETGKLLGDL